MYETIRNGRLGSAVRRHVEREGLRPLSVRTGIPVGQLRGLLQGRAALSTILERVACTRSGVLHRTGTYALCDACS